MQKYKSIYRKQGYRFKSLREKLDAKENALRDSIASVSDVKKEKVKVPAILTERSIKSLMYLN